MVATIVSLASTAYYLNRLRSRQAIFPTTMIALPIIAIALFVFSLACGLRHPPLMVSPDWEWPPFASFEERIQHAFALSTWTFIFGTPTIIVLGAARRLLATSNCT